MYTIRSLFTTTIFCHPTAPCLSPFPVRLRETLPWGSSHSHLNISSPTSDSNLVYHEIFSSQFWVSKPQTKKKHAEIDISDALNAVPVRDVYALTLYHHDFSSDKTPTGRDRRLRRCIPAPCRLPISKGGAHSEKDDARGRERRRRRATSRQWL